MNDTLQTLASGWPWELMSANDVDAAPLPHPLSYFTPTPWAVPLVEELPPALTPWDVFLRLQSLDHVLFLDSALPHPTLGRYSYLTAAPYEWLRSKGRQVYLNDASAPVPESDPFAVLAERLSRYRAEPIAGLPPFQGGAAGLFGYDLCHHLERLPRPRFDEFAVPDLAIGFYDWTIAFDHVLGRSWIVSTGFPETEPSCRRRRAEERLAKVKEHLLGGESRARGPGRREERNGSAAIDLAAGAPLFAVHPPCSPAREGLFSNFDRKTYLATVRRALEYIHAGDCFQVNVAQRLLYPAREPAWETYCRLRERNPATFAGYFDLGDFVLASASPERFLRVDRGEVETRPIKGTRPCGATLEEDHKNIEALLASAKDRAENIMIVDLLRNDLGRVCRYGSVRVPALCRLETYRYVHHLVSEVRGRLRSGLTPIDLMRAAFPGGSVTGAPKIRAMEIIAELEPAARGPYCGCLGYLGFDGSMDTNILIRTMTIGRGWAQFPVGGGIVADSVPAQEYEETWHKAEGLIRALP